ncbi:caspase family protein [Alcanivorax sp. DP30]|uniref:caspase family protein n=1 Tax=Alcanivorax sp. DP30 TaxID=2606217 RepID=UPI001F27AE60|nr:caspase family protein [Alcanivorax sp. DP30]
MDNSRSRKPRPWTRWCAGVMLVLGTISSSQALATKRALLVGVADYPNLPPSLQLDGPAHDAEIVEAILRQRGFHEDNIEQLLTAEGKTLPTRANILAALDRLAESASDDDFYYLHFAGHGSRQPAKATDNNETDGLDEIFLPTDAAGWDSYIGSVKNAILDDEIASYIDRIRDKGADVWVVFDSCHSGTMTRGAAAMPEVKYRRVDSAVLGIPDGPLINRPEGAGAMESETRSRGFLKGMFGGGDEGEKKAEGRGELIAFSAAQSAETTPEMKLPRGAPDRRFHGLFTYTLMDVMGANPQLSYQQLAQQVLSRYQSLPWQATQPLFSASDMNRPVFNDDTPAEQSYFATFKNGKLDIQAGSLSLLSSGATVTVFDSPVAKAGDALGTVTLEGATPVRSWATPDEKQSKDWPATLYVTLDTPVVITEVKVALLPAASLSEKRRKRLQAWLEEIEEAGIGIKVSALDSADILVSEFDDHLWFLQADQSLPCDEQVLKEAARKSCAETRLPQRLLNVALPENNGRQQAALQGALMKIANVTRLMASVQHLPGAQQQLKVSFRIEQEGKQSDFPVNSQPVLTEGDRILFSVTNEGRQSQDVSILFVDSQYGVTQLYPDSGQPNRLDGGESLNFEWDVNVETVGMEHLLVSSQPGTGVNTNLGYLQQAPLNVTTRGLGSSKPPQSSGLNLFTWQVSR